MNNKLRAALVSALLTTSTAVITVDSAMAATESKEAKAAQVKLDMENEVFFEAARSGKVDMLKSLLSAEHQVDQKNSNGDTPLHAATKFGHRYAIACSDKIRASERG